MSQSHTELKTELKICPKIYINKKIQKEKLNFYFLLDINSIRNSNI